MGYHIVIPARLNSQRLPGKILRDIAGKPLIQWVYERAKLCGAESITIAVDDERVCQAAKQFGAEVCMTGGHHQTGTDRLAEVAEQLNLPDDAIVINLQGDEPLIPPAAVKQVGDSLKACEVAEVATLAVPIKDANEIFDPNVVKVVLDKNGLALNFSRAPIPWVRDSFSAKGIDALDKDFNTTGFYRHLGLYAYRARTLKEFSHWEQAPIEKLERLEQLRILWQGKKIYVDIVPDSLPPGIDTEQDLQSITAILQENYKADLIDG